MHTSQLGPVLDTSIEMKTLVFLLALGYVGSEKLDLGYLPPPGSQYAGGRPGDIQIPLEFPKETYSTTLRPPAGDNRGLNPEDYKPTIGIDRVAPGSQDSIPASELPFPQNTQRVPTTTVSYAFTQTTTHPPTEGFETTIGPQITGFPTTEIFNIPSQEPGLTYEGNLNRPGYQQTNQFGQRPAPTPGSAFNIIPSQGLANEGNFNQFGQQTLAPTSGPTQFTGSPIQSLVPSGQQFIGQNRPGQQQILNQVQPGYEQSVSGGLPGASPAFGQNQYRNQSSLGGFGGKQPGYVQPTAIPQGFSSTAQPIGTTYGDNINNIPGSTPNIPQSAFPGQQVQINDYQPGTNIQSVQVPDQQQFVDRQQFPGSQLPTQFGGLENRQPSSTVAPTFAPGFPNQQGSGASITPGTQYGGKTTGPQYPGSQGLSTVDGLNIFQPSTTAAPSFVSGAPNQDYPTGTSVFPGQGDSQYPTGSTPGSYSTPNYPGVKANAASSVYRERPERPQAESDRNAVILNYENVITPEGFAYSFDTSNGIHADESGTAIDGVKANGSYSYIGDDGKLYSIVYTADENGFRPRGDHIPTPPPIPEAIQRVIDQVEKEKDGGISDDGSYNEDKYGYKKYQGAMNGRPQFSDKMISNGADIPEDIVKGQVNKQRLRPQTSQGRPIVSTEEPIGNKEQGLTEDQRFENNNDRQRPGQISTQRPFNPVTGIDEEDNEGGDFESLIENQPSDGRPTGRPFTDATSRPVGSSIRQQYNNVDVPSSGESVNQNVDRRRPFGKIPSSQNLGQDQDSNEYAEDDRPEYTKNRYVNKGSTSRPEFNEEDNRYDTTAPGNYEVSSRRPSTAGFSRRPAMNTERDEQTSNQQTFDKFGRPVNRIPVRRPVTPKDRFDNGPQYEESYNKQRVGGKIPSSKSSTYSPEDSQTVSDDYSSEEDFGTKSPSRLRPGGVKNANNFSDQDEYGQIGTRRRPSTSGLRVSDKDNQYQPENSDEYIDSNVDDDAQPAYYDNRRVTSGPSRTSSDRYVDQELKNFAPAQGSGSIKPISSSTKYGGTRGRPQISKTTVNNEREESGDRPLNSPRPGAKFGQKISRPAVGQKTGITGNKDNENRPLNGSGYQYIPPSRKFEQDEVKGFPTRFIGTTRRPITGRPTPSTVYYKDEGVTGSTRPFMTPNVSQIDSQDFEDRDQTPGQQGQFKGTKYSQYPDSRTTPGKVFGDEATSPTRPTNRPSQQTTGRPQYYEQRTQNLPGFTEERVDQKGRPSEGYDNRNYESTNTPFRAVSSTTPMPSSRPNISSKRPIRPGQQDQRYYTSDENYNKVPGQTAVSSTTPLTSQNPADDGSYQQGTIRPQYQSTYRPAGTIKPTSGYDDSTAQGFPSARPTNSAVSIIPGVFKNNQEDLPSTTYRPNYVITGQPSSSARPSVQVDRYGRPIAKTGSGVTGQKFIPSEQPSSTIRPGGVDMYGRPIRPGYGTTVQEFISGDQNEPSSTARPGVSVDAFGRPIGPGSTTTQEYIGQNGPSSTVSPNVLVDAFGRPITKPGSEAVQGYIPGSQNQLSSTARPDPSVDAFGRPTNRPGFAGNQDLAGQIRPSSTSRPDVLVDAFGRPFITPGSAPQEYTPDFSTPNVQGSKVIGQYQPGVVPSSEPQGYEQGPAIGQGQTVIPSPGSFRGQQKYQPGGSINRPGVSPGVSSTFRPSTERVIGEDFSGPKQQQKFDPERGYYY